MSLRFYPITVSSVITETPDAFTICFQKPDADTYAFKPGQYLTLKVLVNGEYLRRAFSLSSAPDEPELSVTIKCIEGGRVSNYLRQNLEPGQKLDVMPPLGKFTIEPNASNAKHFVLIGCGSGITPLMSMLKSVLEIERQSRVTLLYGSRSEDHIIFRQELEELGMYHPGRLAITHVLSRPSAGWHGRKGRLEGDQLLELLQQAQKASTLPAGYYMCGPNDMMASARVMLTGMGVDEHDVHAEYYSAPVHEAETETETGVPEDEVEYVVTTQPVQLVLDGRTYTVTVTPEKSILHAALQMGIEPPYACEEGVCCTCRAKLLEGMVSMDEREGLSDEELEAGFILTCQSHPLTDDVLVEYG